MPALVGPDSPTVRAQNPPASTAAPPPQPSSAQVIQGIYGTGLAQSQAGYQQQRDALQSQAALYGQYTGLQSGYVGQDLQQQLAQYGLQQEGLGLSQQGLAGAENLANQQYAIAQQQFGLQEKQLGQNAAASGTMNTGGYTQGKTQLGLSEQSAADQYAYQQQQFGIQGKQLDINQRSLTLNEANAKTKADQAIAQLGLQGQISSDQVMQAIGQLDQGQASTLTGILPQIVALMGQTGTGGSTGGGSSAGPRATAGSGSGPWSIFKNGGNAAAQTWAQDFLTQLGAPETPANLQMVYDWEKSEGGGGQFNPLNQGPVPGHPELSGGSQYGGGAASYASYAAGLQGAVDYLHMSNYSTVFADLMAGQGGAATQALWKSPWASSHYGNGKNWNTSPFGG